MFIFTRVLGAPRAAAGRTLAVVSALLGAWACASDGAANDDGADTAGAPSAGMGASMSGASGDQAGSSGRGGGTGTGGNATGEGGRSGSNAASGAPGSSAGHDHGHGGEPSSGEAGSPSIDTGGAPSSDAGGGGGSSGDGGGAGARSAGDAGRGGEPSSEPPELNGCTEYEDRTAADASRDIPWDGSLPLQQERCMKIRLGDSPIFVGDFEEHPLAAHGGDTPSPFSTIPWTFDRAGVFGYYCTVHPDMLGVIWIVP